MTDAPDIPGTIDDRTSEAVAPPTVPQQSADLAAAAEPAVTVAPSAEAQGAPDAPAAASTEGGAHRLPTPVDRGIGVLIVNLGTPDAAEPKAVRS